MQETKNINRKLSEGLSIRVAGLVMFFIVLAPFLQVSVNDKSAQAYVTSFHNMLVETSASADIDSEQWTDLVNDFEDFFDSRTSYEPRPVTLTLRNLTADACPTTDSGSKKTPRVTYEAASERQGPSSCKWSWRNKFTHLRGYNVLELK